MTPHERETELSTEVERELRALDEAIAGLPVEPGLEGVAEIARELRAERPEPDEEFVEKLDAQAAAGFPDGGSPLGRGVRRLLAAFDRGPGAPDGHARRPGHSDARGRRLAWAGSAAAVLIAAVVAVAVFQTSDRSRGLDGDVATEAGGDVPQADSGDVPESGEVTGAGGQALEAAPEADSGDAGGLQFRAPASGGSDRGQAGRKVQRDAVLELSTGPNDVRRVADEAIEVIEDNRGIVFSSEIKERGDETSVARLNVSVPTDRLQPTMAALSDLAMVESRTDSSLDITGEFRSARSFLRELQAERESLLSRLAKAETEQESESIRRRLRIVRNEIAAARAELQRVERRADRSAIDITVRGDGSTDGAWTIGAAADDAVDVLRFLAGIGIVAAAVIVPLAAILLVAWLIHRRVVRWQRQQALET